MLLRPRTVDDLPACIDLMRRTHELDGYPRYWRRDAERFLVSAAEQAAWVAEQEAQIVGHVAVHDAAGDPTLAAAQLHTGLPPSALVVIARLLVSPTLRRVGVGRSLLQHATSWAQAQGRQPVLDVVQEEVGAIRMYEGLGWQRLEPLVLPIEGHAPLLLWVYLGPPTGE